jgi:hypothetical protein
MKFPKQRQGLPYITAASSLVMGSDAHPLGSFLQVGRAVPCRGMLCYVVRADPVHICRPPLPALHCTLQLELAVKTQQADFTDVRVADALKMVSELELLEVNIGAAAAPECAAGVSGGVPTAGAWHTFCRWRCTRVAPLC